MIEGTQKKLNKRHGIANLAENAKYKFRSTNKIIKNFENKKIKHNEFDKLQHSQCDTLII